MPLAFSAAISPPGALPPANRLEATPDPEHGHVNQARPADRRPAVDDDLTPEARAEVTELKKIDQEVRAHEQAHLRAAGPYASGGASFTYATGPDGKQYAVGGEVKIDISPESDPEATLRKAEAIQAAAAAPAEPSSQDRGIGAKASQMAHEAQRELAESPADETAPRLGAYDPPSPDDAGRLLSLLA